MSSSLIAASAGLIGLLFATTAAGDVVGLRRAPLTPIGAPITLVKAAELHDLLVDNIALPGAYATYEGHGASYSSTRYFFPIELKTSGTPAFVASVPSDAWENGCKPLSIKASSDRTLTVTPECTFRAVGDATDGEANIDVSLVDPVCGAPMMMKVSVTPDAGGHALLDSKVLLRETNIKREGASMLRDTTTIAALSNNDLPSTIQPGKRAETTLTVPLRLLGAMPWKNMLISKWASSSSATTLPIRTDSEAAYEVRVDTAGGPITRSVRIQRTCEFKTALTRQGP